MLNNMQGNVLLEFSPRSQLLSSLFDRLNDDSAEYAVMNNYEGLPWVIPSDVDITVSAVFFSRLDGFVQKFSREHNALLVQKIWHGNKKCAYIVGVGPDERREFVQLDFFVAFSTQGCPALFSHEELVTGRRQLRNFWIPRPEIELVFIAMRRLFKDDWSERHCSRLAELHGQISSTDWLPARYSWLRETLDAAINNDLTTLRQRRVSDWARLRKVSRSNLSFWEQVANAVLQSWRIGLRLRDETGHLAVIIGSFDSIDQDAMVALDILFHRRLWIDDAMLVCGFGKALLTLPVRLALLKRRKGLIFLQADPNHPFALQLASRLDRLGLVDQVLLVGPEPDSYGLQAPIARVTTTSMVIEAIVTRQSLKTARAIARGGSQTSG